MRSLLVVLIVLVATPLFAHSPKSVDLSYDAETGILSIEIAHSVNAASKHYIHKVVVEVNGEKHVEQNFTMQTNNEQQHAIYKIIDVEEGDKIAATAYCNISGRKKGELEVTLKKYEELTE